MRQRLWTTWEREYLRRHYGPKAPARKRVNVMVRELRRSKRAIMAAARTFGLAQTRTVLDDDQLEHLKKMHAAGYTIKAMMRGLQVTMSVVYTGINRLGLKQPRFPAMERRRLLVMFQQNLWRAGVSSMDGLRKLAWQRRCAQRGWPQAITPLECDLLDALQDGPCHQSGLARLTGHCHNRVHARLISMERRGLVVEVASFHRGQRVWALQWERNAISRRAA